MTDVENIIQNVNSSKIAIHTLFIFPIIVIP